MEIKQQFHNFIIKYGRPVLIVRHKTQVKCKCHTTQYGADKNCPICLGNGYLFKAEKYLARDKGAAIPETLPRAIKDTKLGDLSVPSRMFYFESDVRPDLKDYIVDCQWDKTGKPIFDEYSGIYEVNMAEPFRGDHGEIEYFRAACKYDPVNATNFKAYIAKNTNLITYHVAIGGI